ncbi:hypothetical protein NCS52_00987200 [Fusarium sp. LHS14.1]|nr:hypothetical protein NCS52_00987200 [Fusarium sp. LHS14.1]
MALLKSYGFSITTTPFWILIAHHGGVIFRITIPTLLTRRRRLRPDISDRAGWEMLKPHRSEVTDTQSLRSSILNYKWENGRRYHAYQEGSYWAPNDDRQQEAEDLMHEVYRIILNDKLYEAPIGDKPQNVLDLGCGTGIWAIEFADMHPSADVLGVDLSPIQPNFVPPNCRFEVDDINQDWTYPENKFDFVHLRGLTGCIPDWTKFYEGAIKHVKPGGWIEHVELWGTARSDDDTLRGDSPLKTWVDIFTKLGEMTGKTFFWDHKAAESVREGGFINVTERRIKVPIGTWPKDKQLKQWGAWNRQFLLQALEGFSIRGLTEMLGWKYEDAQLYLSDMRKELTNPKLHSYLEVTVVYGQRPEAPDEEV